MKRTPLYEAHIRAGAKTVPFAGFEMPVQYEGITAEHLAVRNRVGLFDVSHMGNFFVEGPDAEAFLQYVTSNDVTKLYPGKVQYSTLTNEQGGIVDDLLVYRLGDQAYMLVVNASNIDKDFGHLQRYLKDFPGVNLENRSEDFAIMAVQGPESPALMQLLTDEDLQGMKFYTHKTVHFAGLPDILVSTTGYTGEKGFEIYAPASTALDIWQALTETGRSFGLALCGLGARDTLRLEKGYCLYGNDINDETTPLEAGLGWITKLNTDFVGADKLRAQKAEGVKRRLTGFKMKEKGIPRHGYAIVNAEGEQIGEVTSGTMSPVLKEGIGMGYVPAEYAGPGTEIFIRVRKKDIPAETVALPFV